ncbi:MAG TPA: response regulator transcription factor [Saprospiraceae bacterium]|nr:response regulator transcription factor [Saprospiraceae bacterium]
MQNKINIALADDQVLFREGIASLIKNEEGFSLVMEADNGLDFLAKLQVANELPDILLMDMEMPGMDGMQLNDELRKKFPSIKVIVLSVHARERLIARMIQAGASGYLLKNCNKEELLNAIRNVFNNGFYITPDVLKALQSPTANAKGVLKVQSIPIELSQREIEVLKLICEEYSNIEIAEKLFKSVRTVDGHRNNLLAKTSCHNTAGLVLFAVKHRIFEVLF